jgi:hypothetical protein
MPIASNGDGSFDKAGDHKSIYLVVVNTQQ